MSSRYEIEEMTMPVLGRVKIEDESGEEHWYEIYRNIDLMLDTIPAPPGYDVAVNTKFLWSPSRVENAVEMLNAGEDPFDELETGREPWRGKRDYWTNHAMNFINDNCSDGEVACFFPVERVTHDIECKPVDTPRFKYQVLTKWADVPTRKLGNRWQIEKHGNYKTFDEAKARADRLASKSGKYDDKTFIVEEIVNQERCVIRETTLPKSMNGAVEEHRVIGYKITSGGGS